MSNKGIFSKIIPSLRRRSAGQDTAQDRSRERYRLAALSGSATLVGKVVSVGTSVLTVRLALRYLGPERYGMWMTISSVVMMMGFADFGMSSGLVNLVADAMGRGDRATARRASASAFWMLTTVAIVLSATMLVAYPSLDTARLFNVHSPIAMRESGPALLVLFICFVINLPLGAVRSVQTGLQKTFINSLWGILGSLFSLAALLLAIRLHASLPMLVLSLSGPPVAAAVLNGFELFGWSHPELLPIFSAFSRESALRLSRMGFMFFLLQMSLAIGMQTDNIVIAQIMGAKAVSAYAIPARLFNIVTSLLVMLSGILWPAYADAFARSDVQWIRRTFLRVTLVGTGATLILTPFLIIFGNTFLNIWVGPQVRATPQLLTTFGVQCVLYAYLQPIAFLLNGLGKLREQVVSAVAMAILNLALSIVLVRRYGIIGAVLGTVIALAVAIVIPVTIVAIRALNQLRQGQTPEHAAANEVQQVFEVNQS